MRSPFCQTKQFGHAAKKEMILAILFSSVAAIPAAQAFGFQREAQGS
jgi:hypothetical protein